MNSHSQKACDFEFDSLPALPQPMRAWSGTRSDYPRDKTVASLFEEVAATHPHSVAVVSEETTLSYSDLNARANELAYRLRKMGVGPEVMVGCCMERSVDLIVALLGILKAGGAYVPLDPSYPLERLDFIVAETRAPLIITNAATSRKLSDHADQLVLHIDELDFNSPAESVVNPSSVADATSLAYVMYTSGSTGRPKGVMVENRSIVRLVRNTNYCNFGPEEVFLQYAPVSFDASTFEIWGALLNGGRLVLMPSRHSSLEDLARVIHEQGVTTLWLTAGLFALLVEQRLESLRPIRQLLAGGDVLSPRHVRMCLKEFPNTTLINGYGPTENTTFTCCHIMRDADSVRDSVPIGKPISNTRVFILDDQLRPVSPGESGELYAAGDGLARGYLNDPEATAAKFLPGPSSSKGERMYRTGDVARWREDGVIEFLGRIDDQVKILGHRIEPGEIESILRMHPDIRQVYVVPRMDGDGSKRLFAFYVTAPGHAVTPAQLRAFAKQKLPQYMVPAKFVALDSIPLSPNGKVDRAALTNVDVTESKETILTDDPAMELHTKLTELWKNILRVPHVGLDDNFFDLGGDSLLLIALHSRLQKLANEKVSLTDLFEFSTIRKLANHLQGKRTDGASLSDVQQQAQRQREAFARLRDRHPGGAI